MKRKNLIFIILLCIILGSCVKEPVSPDYRGIYKATFEGHSISGDSSVISKERYYQIDKITDESVCVSYVTLTRVNNHINGNLPSFDAVKLDRIKYEFSLIEVHGEITEDDELVMKGVFSYGIKKSHYSTEDPYGIDSIIYDTIAGIFEMHHVNHFIEN